MQAFRRGSVPSLVRLFGLAALLAGCAARHSPASGLGNWRIEAESPAAQVTMANGTIDIDTPKGITLWYLPRLSAPVTIEFDVMAMAEGGPNDQVSDVNAIWKATETAAADGSVLARRR